MIWHRRFVLIRVLFDEKSERITLEYTDLYANTNLSTLEIIIIWIKEFRFNAKNGFKRPTPILYVNI